jgi:hypothetical protein
VSPCRQADAHRPGQVPAFGLRARATAYQQAIRLKPDFAEAHVNLGNALAAKDRLDEAIEQVREEDEELRGFRAEAAELLGMKDEKTHHKDTKDTKKKP